jgi:hypothetical protein
MTYQRSLAALMLCLGIGVVAACGIKFPPSFDVNKTDAVRSPTPAPSVDNSAELLRDPPEVRIPKDVRFRVESMLGRPEPSIKVDCAASSGENWTCRARYSGATIDFRVRIYDRQQYGAFEQWKQEITNETRFLARTDVHRRFWDKVKKELRANSQVRCDKMPELKVVRVDADTGYRCYHYDGNLTRTWRLKVLAIDGLFFERD